MPRSSLLLPPQTLSISSKPCSPPRTPLPVASAAASRQAEGGTGVGQDSKTATQHESSGELEKWLQRQVEFLQSTGLAPVQLKPQQLSAPKLLKPPRSPLKSQASNHVKEDVSQLLHIASTGPSAGSQKLFPSQSSPHLHDDKSSIARWNQTAQPEKMISPQLEHNLPAPQPSSPQSVMAPSHGAVNDAMRVRNGGRRTSPRRQMQRMLRSVQSEPFLGVAAKPAWGAPAVEAWSLPSSPAGVESKTPRTVRGLVRKHSEVTVGMPPPGSWILQRRVETPVMSRRRSPRQASRSPSPSPTSSRVLSQTLSPKKVTFADRELVDESSTFLAQSGKSSRSEEDLKQAARVKSKQLMGSLYDLRRVAPPGQRPSSPDPKAPGSPAPPAQPTADAAAPASVVEKEQDASSPEGTTKPSTAEQEKAETMMRSILRDVHDTEEPLRELEATLIEAHDPVGLLNGSRHATAVVSSRSLAVVSRKAHLCQVADARLKAFEAAHSRKELHFQEVLAGADVDEGLLGVKEWLSTNVHQHCEPVDADKSSFQLFVTTFGLPSKHHYIVKLRALHKECLDWWVSTCLQMAEDGVPTSGELPTISASQIRRLMEVVVMISQNPKHPAVKKLEELRSQVLTVEALHNSKKHLARDEMTVERSSVPQPDSAKNAAEAILAEITHAVAEGAPKGHWALKEAKGLEMKLRTEEKDRRAQVVNNYAVELDTKDTETASKYEDEKRVPPVGPASEYADLIDSAIQEVIKRYEVDEQHDLIQDAQARAGTLRERDGERKRLAAREKRLAEQAAANEQQQTSD